MAQSKGRHEPPSHRPLIRINKVLVHGRICNGMAILQESSRAWSLPCQTLIIVPLPFVTGMVGLVSNDHLAMHHTVPSP